jgi:hypothetical protein
LDFFFLVGDADGEAEADAEGDGDDVGTVITVFAGNWSPPIAPEPTSGASFLSLTCAE